MPLVGTEFICNYLPHGLFCLHVPKFTVCNGSNNLAVAEVELSELNLRGGKLSSDILGYKYNKKVWSNILVSYCIVLYL